MKDYRSSPPLDAVAIKAAINPVDFYMRELNLCRFGYRSGQWATAGHCPFHDDNKPGSFKINQETGAFKCWSCGASGSDIIAFLKLRDSIDFFEVLKRLSCDWGCA